MACPSVIHAHRPPPPHTTVSPRPCFSKCYRRHARLPAFWSTCAYYFMIPSEYIIYIKWYSILAYFDVGEQMPIQRA